MNWRGTRLARAWRRRSLGRWAWFTSVMGFALLAVADGWYAYEQQAAALSRQYDQALVRVASAYVAALREKVQLNAARAGRIYREEVGKEPGPPMRYVLTGVDGRWLGGEQYLAELLGGLTPPRLGMAEPGAVQLSDARYRDESVRVAQALGMFPSPEGSSVPARFLLVENPALRVQANGELLRSVLKGGVLRWAAAVALVGVLLAFLLRPLRSLQGELAARGEKDYQPVDANRPQELVPLVQTLNHLMAAQRASVEQQRQFLADASHQLRTPLAVLRTQLQGLSSGQLSAAETLPKMLRTVDRSADLANHLLSAAKVEQLAREAAWVPLSLSTVISEVALEFAPLMARKRLDFSLDAAAALRVRSDAWMLGELVRNLLSNAIHHSPKGARLGIVVRRLRHEVELIVWDCGGGVSQSVQERLFEPFAGSREGTGIGLGLAICRRIADAMAAQVHLFNRQENGVVVGCDAVVRWPDSMVAGPVESEKEAPAFRAVGGDAPASDPGMTAITRLGGKGI